jgi:DNA-binding NtrC family response regulator
MSRRREHTYCRINCAAIPETLLESELFGHEKGSFTGAVRQKLGRFEEADAGTVFLDEIGEMSRALQAKLLRFLEDGTFSRVGGNEELRVNVRLIAATNRDIIRDIRQGQFREDLYHRLNVVQFRPPPLRERTGDVTLLADHFLQYFNTVMKKHLRGFSQAAREKMHSHHWPGNVRELRNVIERAVIFESAPEIQAASLPDFKFEGRLRKEDAPAPVTPTRPAGSLDDQMAEFERQLIVGTLEHNQFNLSRCAEQLKISRHALRYRMQRLNITEKTEHAEPSVVSSGEEIS